MPRKQVKDSRGVGFRLPIKLGSVCVVGISMDQPYQQGSDFQDFCNEINRLNTENPGSIKAVIFLLTGDLKRHYIGEEEASKLEEEWKRNQEFQLKSLGELPVEFISWKDLTGRTPSGDFQESFSYYYEIVSQQYNKNSQFRDKVDKHSHKYVKRMQDKKDNNPWAQKGVALDFEKLPASSIVYSKEEGAARALLAGWAAGETIAKGNSGLEKIDGWLGVQQDEEVPFFMTYPDEGNAVFQWVYDTLFIKKGSDPLPWVVCDLPSRKKRIEKVVGWEEIGDSPDKCVQAISQRVRRVWPVLSEQEKAELILALNGLTQKWRNHWDEPLNTDGAGVLNGIDVERSDHCFTARGKETVSIATTSATVEVPSSVIAQSSSNFFKLSPESEPNDNNVSRLRPTG